jgi:chromosome segregation ATPase
MTGGFQANVPVRKPRTKIASVISELTAGPPEHAEPSAERVAATAPPAREAAADAGAPRGPAVLSASLISRPAATPPPKTPAAPAPVSDAREQIARLKERLAAAQARTGAIEPKRTAAAVRDVVEGLRERLETSARERSELAEALDSARATLARSAIELERERRAREVFEVQAEERRRIADDAVAEAEALAAERDQVLGELAQHRRLEVEQTSLLTQVEAALAERDAEREAAARELAGARDEANLRAAEIADLETRLRDETTSRTRAEAQCRELEAEIARLTEARDALQSIEAVLVQRRGAPRHDKR